VRVVIDSGVFVSAAITPRGTAAELVARGVAGGYEFIVSPRLLEELKGVLNRNKFRRLLSISQAERFIADISAAARHADDPNDVPAVTRDIADDYLVALAVAAGASLLVSGDRDLLDPPDLQVIVVTPRAFLDRLDAE
jgi:putative PIN family toxin of toxin-antitoxin system